MDIIFWTKGLLIDQQYSPGKPYPYKFTATLLVLQLKHVLLINLNRGYSDPQANYVLAEAK